MAQRPELPLEAQAAIERAREHIHRHALVTWRLLFGPDFARLPVALSAEIISSPQRKPASIKLEFCEYSSALLDAEAQHYISRAQTESDLRLCLEAVVACIESEVMQECDRPSHDFHCPKMERRQAIANALADRIEHWIKRYRQEKHKTQTTLKDGVSHEGQGYKTVKSTTFPKRASWLNDRFVERGWNRNDPLRHGGPDPKTIDKILNGTEVRPDVLERLAVSLSKKYQKVILTEIPRD